MTYENAKKLKDAGYPQGNHATIREYECEDVECCDLGDSESAADIPLEEILLACHKEAGRELIIWSLGDDWMAGEGDEVGTHYVDDYPKTLYSAKSLGDALALLWVALTK